MPKKSGPAPALRGHYPVAIIGAGPTGLTVANLLARYGIEVILIERNRETVQEPRAVSIDDESLRTMQAIGVVDTVLQEVVAGYGSEYFTPKGTRFLSVKPTGTPYGYPRRNAFRQPVLERQLREALAGSELADTLFGCACVDITQSPNGVTLDLDCGGDARLLECDYLVAADGASSFVRGKLGIALQGQTFSERWLIIDLAVSPTDSAETVVFCDVKRPCIALPGPGNTRRFEFKLLPGEKEEEMLADSNVASLLRTHGAASTSQIIRKVVYTFHARVAPVWSVGRIHLAGDACHLTPPFAGQGMNSGIRDAHNLAWKLALVVRGVLPRSILDSYQEERRPHVQEMIALALKMGRIMGPPSRFAGILQQNMFRLLGLWPHARDYFAEMKYKPKPRFRSGLVISRQRDSFVGRLIPQPHVSRGGEDRVLLDEVLGDDFAVLVVSERPAGDICRALDNALFARLRAKKIVIRNGGICATNKSSLLEVLDVDGVLSRALDRDLVLLIRPDRYVLGAFSLFEPEAFIPRLARLLDIDAPSGAAAH